MLFTFRRAVHCALSHAFFFTLFFALFLAFCALRTACTVTFFSGALVAAFPILAALYLFSFFLALCFLFQF